jgi:penicillin-binding protein 1A
MLKRWWQFLLVGGLGLFLIAGAIAGLATALIYPSLPSLEVLTDYRPKMPLRVYSEEGAVLGEFGEERRAVVRLQETPLVLRQAILAAEDERFYEHGGIDTLGVLRAAVSNVMSGGTKEGASTITMQVARNFFLSSEKTLRRKINEALLATKIEHALSKDEILELYINHIYLGQRAYGFASASQIYFGKPLQQVSLAEAAMLAGLPKAPSAYNPVVNPTRAKARQNYVLKRMRTLGYIKEADYQKAKDQRLSVRYNTSSSPTASGHLAEMARLYMFQKYGEQIYTSGMRVYTTVRVAEQKAAEEAVRAGVVDFNRRRGYAGAEAEVSLPAEAEARDKAIDEALQKREEVNGLLPAVVTLVDKKRIRAVMRSGDEIDLGESELSFAKNYLGAKVPTAKRIKPGAIIRVVRLAPGKPWQLTYLPQVEAALVALSPENGAIRALVGGFDFSRNQFNHVTQAWRQPGSSFKPFVYSAALERGITPATIFEDSPIELDPAETGGELWEPKNFDGEMSGPVTVRNALTKSKNLVSIRLLQATGADYARQHALLFGFTADRIPPYMTLALGVGEVTPLQMATGYAVFASGGKRPRPFFMTKVTDKDGRVLEAFQPPEPQVVLNPRNAFIMTSMMQDVARRGTAAAASSLGRQDLAGKTGTTNDHRDAWFSGYNRHRVAIAWVGYDQPKPMGGNETGGVTALPIWMGYMRAALKGVPDAAYAVPDGVVSLRIDPATGLQVQEGGRDEYFYHEFVPVPGGGWFDPAAPMVPAPIEEKSTTAPAAAGPRI